MRVGMGIATVFAAALVIAGCGGGGAGDTGMILKIGNGAEVQSMDPQMVAGVAEHRVLSSLFQGLVEIDAKTLEPVPAVAEAWTISPDGLTYLFTLRKNAKWSNGDPVTAPDFVYSWKRMLSPILGAEYAYLLHCLKNGKAFNEGTLEEFAQVGVKALDDFTLEVTLDHPVPYFLTMQTHTAWYPVQQAAIEKFGKIDERDTPWTRPGNLVGNGAFMLAEWRPNEVIRVRRNPQYWNAAAVRADGINFYPIDNELTEERSFRSGELHITSTIPLHKVDVYRKENPDLLNIHPYLGVYFYRMNTRQKPFDDVRVRRAFSMALDREELARNVLKGDEQPAGFFTPPDTAGYTSSAKIPFDVAQARELLAAAGYPDGAGLPPVDILYNTSEAHKTIAEAVQRMWKENLNAEVRLLNQDWKVYLASMNNLDYSVARSAWIGDVVDPVNFLECFLTAGGNNRTGWSSPEYDALIRKAYAEADPVARLAVLEQAEALLLEASPIVPVYFYTWKYLKSRELKGQTPNILGYMRWTDMYLEPAGK